MIVDQFVLDKYVELISATGLSVFSAGAVPQGQLYPYVIVTEIQTISRVFEGKQWVVFGTVQIVTGNNNPVGRKQAYQLAEVVDNAIDNGIQHSGNGYIMDSTYLQSSSPLDEQGSFGYIYRNIRVYTHQISLST
jgi:hypothetical protein